MGCNCCCCRCCHRQIPEDPNKELLSTITIKAASCLPKYETDRLAACRLSDFEYKEKIGSGRFGKVYKVMERHTQQVLAMKEVYRKHDMYLLEPRLEQEYLILSKLKSYWLLDIIQCYETPSKLCMLLDYLPGPSLVRLARDHTASPRQNKIYAAEMLLALQAVHHHGYIHRDIKLSNFLLDAEGHVKLCDFGSCIQFLPADVAQKVFPLETDFRQAPTSEVLDLRQMLIQENQYKPLVPHGTSCYCAPEVIRLATTKPPTSTPYSYLCDYWSLGVCYYYLLFGKLPFHADEKVQLPSRIMNWQKTLKFPRARSAEDAAGIGLMRGLLREEVHRLGRNGIYDLLHYRYFDNVDWLPRSPSQTALGDKNDKLADSESLELSSVANRDKKPRHGKKKKEKEEKDKSKKDKSKTNNETPSPSPLTPLQPPPYRESVQMESISTSLMDISPQDTTRPNTTPGASRILHGESPASTPPVDFDSEALNDHNAPDANIGSKVSNFKVPRVNTGSRVSSHNVSQTPVGCTRVSTVFQTLTGPRKSRDYSVSRLPVVSKVSGDYSVSQAPAGSRLNCLRVSRVYRDHSQAKVSTVAIEEKSSGKVDPLALPDAKASLHT